MQPCVPEAAMERKRSLRVLRGDPPPHRRCPRGGRVASADQDLQLVRLQRGGRRLVLRRGPPPKLPLRQTLVAEPEPLAVIDEELDGRPTAIAEDEHRPREWVDFERGPAKLRQTVDATPEV